MFTCLRKDWNMTIASIRELTIHVQKGLDQGSQNSLPEKRASVLIKTLLNHLVCWTGSEIDNNSIT